MAASNKSLKQNLQITTTMAAYLPRDIIQYILTWMNEKQAARASLLSKSWRRAWCTRADLSFDQCDFWKRMDDFPRFTNKTLQSYQDSNLVISSFRLSMRGNRRLAAELISKAIELGVSDLDIHIDIDSSRSCFLPEEVLRSETLTRLRVSGFTIDLARSRIRKKGEICPNLKSLTLALAPVNGDLFRDLISKLPSIEEFTWWKPPTMPRRDHDSDEEVIEERFDKNRIKAEEFDELEFHKLKYLNLRRGGAFDTAPDYMTDLKSALYTRDLSPKFPRLKELVIFDNHTEKNVRICSQSLEIITINILNDRIWNGEFDVPNIREFTLSSTHVPRLVMKTSREREWESHVDIKCAILNPNSWFLSLSQLVEVLKLSLSRVSLSLCVDVWDFIDYHGYVGDGLALENLTVHYGHELSLQFLDSLLWSFRPKFVKIAKQCVVFWKVNFEKFPQLRSLPWETIMLDKIDYDFYYRRFFDLIGYFSFQLN